VLLLKQERKIDLIHTPCINSTFLEITVLGINSNCTSVNLQYTNNILSATFSLNKCSNEGLPFWIWIIVGAVCFLVIAGIIFVIVRSYRNEQRILREIHMNRMVLVK